MKELIVKLISQKIHFTSGEIIMLGKQYLWKIIFLCHSSRSGNSKLKSKLQQVKGVCFLNMNRVDYILPRLLNSNCVSLFDFPKASLAVMW